MVISGSRGTGPISATNPVNATSEVFDATKPPRSRLSAEEATPSPALDEYRVPPSEPRKAVIAAAEASARYPRLKARMGRILVETQDLAGRSVDRVRAVLADYDKTGSG